MKPQCFGCARHGTILVGVLVMGAVLGFAKDKTITKDRIELSTEYGKFVLQELTLTQNRYSVLFSGTITNNTDRNWAVVYLTLQFLDKSGAQISSDDRVENEVPVFRLQKGATKTISRTIPWEINFRAFRPPTGRIANFNVAHNSRQSQYDLLYVFSLEKPKVSDKLVFEDDSIRVAFAVVESQIQFSMQNRTELPIEINWDQSAFIDFTGQAHRVIHAGIKWNDREKPQAPTTVPPTARISDIVYPADYAEWSGSDWIHKPVLPPAELSYKGQTFSIFVPLRINGEIKNYLFTIRIADVLI